MSTDATIRDQTYSFFLMEAPELLQTIEYDLLSLMEDHSTAKVHNLMRMTHTLKGAAASVGLDTIKTVAHSLEDVFKALYNPAVVIDPELETLLFQGYECLRLPLSAEFTGTAVNEPEILNRAASVFAQLQGKLGDFFDQEAQIPSSAELGFDITQSIFETGVQKRLENLASELVNPEADKVAAMLHELASVFIGLAESLGLPGFGAIAQTAIAALEAHPDLAVTVASTALADFRQGKAAVLGGDRAQGGEPSATLKQLAVALSPSPLLDVEPGFLLEPLEVEPLSAFDAIVDRAGLDLTNSSLNAVEDTPVLSLEQLFGSFNPEPIQPVAAEANPEATVPPSLGSQVNLLEPAEAEPELLRQAQTKPVRSASAPSGPKETAPAQTVRVDLEKLQRLNYLSGELLTNQNRQVAADEQLQQVVQKLQQQLQQHQQILRQMRDWSNRMLIRPERQHSWARLSLSPWSGFDSLEMDPYSEFHVLLQSALEDTVQLEESTEAIALFTQQSNQTLEKQQRLLTNVRDDLMTARMLPVGEIFNRFPRMLQQLAAVHGKKAELQLVGNDVLVDKAIAEKLYDPILHLVRNAFDHGIESREVRLERGKPETGQIRLHAYQQNRWTMVAVSDDGKGLDFEKIFERAIEMNLLALEHTSNLTEAKLLDLLFEPGFSTARELSDLSGRGMGLDVVRTQLEAMQGSITIQSEPQRGTTFLLQIPLTLNIVKVLVCQAGSQVYAFLTDAIEQIVLPQADQIKDWRDQRVFQWRQETTQMVPLRKLSELIEYTNPLPSGPLRRGEPEPAAPVLLLRQGSLLLALEVDSVLGEQELVIRPVTGMIMPPPYVQGCCILADGRLTLMIDSNALLEQEQKPTAKELPTLHRPAPAPPSSSTVASQTTLTQILVVDDSITLRQNLALVLQKAGYQAIQARYGGEAIVQLQQHPAIGLVICDVEMPGMNGFEFLSHRSGSPALAKVPVVMLTSRGGGKHRQIALELGANAYLTKPYLDQELLTTVAGLINPLIANPVSS